MSAVLQNVSVVPFAFCLFGFTKSRATGGAPDICSPYREGSVGSVGLERNPKDKKKKKKKKQKHHPSADYTLTFWKKSSPPLTLPSEAARAKQRETEKINTQKTTQSTQFLHTQCNQITRRLLGPPWKATVSSLRARDFTVDLHFFGYCVWHGDRRCSFAGAE